MYSVVLLQYVVLGSTYFFYFFKCCLLLCCQGSNLKARLDCQEETVPVVQCGWNPAPHTVCCQCISLSPAQHSNIEILHKTIIRIDYCFIFSKRSLSYTIEFRELECWQVISETLSNPIRSPGITFFNSIFPAGLKLWYYTVALFAFMNANTSHQKWIITKSRRF